jgi:hypothetical protein
MHYGNRFARYTVAPYAVDNELHFGHKHLSRLRRYDRCALKYLRIAPIKVRVSWGFGISAKK